MHTNEVAASALLCMGWQRRVAWRRVEKGCGCWMQIINKRQLGVRDGRDETELMFFNLTNCNSKKITQAVQFQIGTVKIIFCEGEEKRDCC